jgi:serine/threonine-protein kinase SRPK3
MSSKIDTESSAKPAADLLQPSGSAVIFTTIKKKYVALEIYINRSKVHRELPIYTHISGIKSDHYGQKYLRKFLDSFEINSPNGKHICLVNQALSMTMEDYRCLLPNRGY